MLPTNLPDSTVRSFPDRSAVSSLGLGLLTLATLVVAILVAGRVHGVLAESPVVAIVAASVVGLAVTVGVPFAAEVVASAMVARLERRRGRER